MEAPAPKVKNLRSWSGFEEHVVQWLDSYRQQQQAQTGCTFDDWLFRGHGDSKWGLETTLERSFPMDRSDKTQSLTAYYRKISAAKPVVETLTEKIWADVPEFTTFLRLLKKNPHSWLDSFLSNRPAIYRYLIYLRHHGFPSPLLDWTVSPYVAALFAFDAMTPGATHVCVYAYLQNPSGTHSSDEHLFVVGPYVQTHRRHFLQQSRYTMCVRFSGDDYTFLPHEAGMLGRRGQNGELFKFCIPAVERTAALKKLELMNITPYSLLGSEDALIRTIARRECLFKNWDL